MVLEVTIGQQKYRADMEYPIDISLPLGPGKGATAWHVGNVSYSPVVAGDFIGDIKQGGPLNFKNVRFNPHGNGTHTECIAHIAPDEISIHEVLSPVLKTVQVISVEPEQFESDLIINKRCFDWNEIDQVEALVIRTLPNDPDKKNRDYSGTNPPYILPEVIEQILTAGIKHLLIDLPSIDKEDDGGSVKAHHTFWSLPDNPDTSRTITELIYVPDKIKDGPYLLDIQIAPFILDASPSRPILYPLRKI